MSRRRLVYLVNQARFFVSHRLALALAAVDAGYDVHVLAPPGREAEQIREAGLPLHEVPMQRSISNPARDLLALTRVVRLYRQLSPDIVHHVALKSILIGGLAARRTGVHAAVNAVTGSGYLFHAHSAAVRALRAVTLPFLRRALALPNSCTILQNRDDLQLFLAHRLLTPERAVVIRGSGVDPSRFRPSGRPTAPISVLLPARVLEVKGVRDFVGAARLLKAEGSPLRFRIAGPCDPANPSAIPEAEIRGWEAEGLVEWLGPRDDMEALMQASAIVCLPSHGGEGVPKALLEGAASGRALVATDVPGCRDVVRQGVNGYLVPPRQPERLAAALGSLAADAELRQRMGEAGRSLVLREFTLERVVADTLQIYSELLSP